MIPTISLVTCIVCTAVQVFYSLVILCLVVSSRVFYMGDYIYIYSLYGY